MIKYIDSSKMGRGHHGWLDSYFHFSFAEYYNPQNINYGVIRVINDDIIQAGKGFDTHPHKDMEIISYVIGGELSHRDSMGNNHTITRGQVQYMSAGSGITHSEYNHGNEELRLAQIWIYPDKSGYDPNYGDYRFKLEDRLDSWLPIVTSYNNSESKAPIQIHADVNMYATIISEGKQAEFKINPNRQAYLVLLDGKAIINNIQMNMRDAMEISEENISILAEQGAHIIIIEMALSK